MNDQPVGIKCVQTGSVVQTQQLAQCIAAVVHAGDVLVLDGPLGAGKTTFVRGFGEHLGVRGPITSPTFIVARTHPSLVGGAPLVHVDAYRLRSVLELEDLDIDFDGSIVVLEWGKGFVEHFVTDRLEITFERPNMRAGSGMVVLDDSDEPRAIVLRGYGTRWKYFVENELGE